MIINLTEKQKEVHDAIEALSKSRERLTDYKRIAWECFPVSQFSQYMTYGEFNAVKELSFLGDKYCLTVLEKIHKLAESYKREFKKGQFIATSEGEYSDYSVNGFFLVKKDFYLDEVAESYKEKLQSILKEQGKYDEDYSIYYCWDYDDGTFISFEEFIISLDLVEKLEYYELHDDEYKC